MGLPSKRRTTRSKKERASHFALKPIKLSVCAKCGGAIKPHHACPTCGAYRGRVAKNVTKRTERILRKNKTKA